MPNGLTLNSSTGNISGTPTAQGTSTFTIQVTDANSQTNSRQYTLTINNPPGGGGSNGGDFSSGGGGCGFIKDDGKGPRAKGEGLAFAMMLVITLSGIALRRFIVELKMRRVFSVLNKGLRFFVVAVLLAQIAACRRDPPRQQLISA